MACYQQVGWGVYADAAFLDEEGGIWHYENEMGLPREDAERLELLGKTEDVEHVGQLDKRRVEEIRSLIAAIQPEEVKLVTSLADDIRYKSEPFIGVENVVCPNCGAKTRLVPLDVSNLLFLARETLQNTTVDVSKWRPM